MGGTTGTFYTQFGLTMAVAVAISLVNALTLSPALCALIMTPHMEAVKGEKLSFSSRFHMAFDSAFHRLVLKYKSGVFFMLKRKWLAGALLLVACAGLFILMKHEQVNYLMGGTAGINRLSCLYQLIQMVTRQIETSNEVGEDRKSVV